MNPVRRGSIMTISKQNRQLGEMFKVAGESQLIVRGWTVLLEKSQPRTTLVRLYLLKTFDQTLMVCDAIITLSRMNVEVLSERPLIRSADNVDAGRLVMEMPERLRDPSQSFVFVQGDDILLPRLNILPMASLLLLQQRLTDVYFEDEQAILMRSFCLEALRQKNANNLVRLCGLDH